MEIYIKSNSLCSSECSQFCWQIGSYIHILPFHTSRLYIQRAYLKTNGIHSHSYKTNILRTRLPGTCTWLNLSHISHQIPTFWRQPHPPTTLSTRMHVLYGFWLPWPRPDVLKSGRITLTGSVCWKELSSAVDRNILSDRSGCGPAEAKVSFLRLRSTHTLCVHKYCDCTQYNWLWQK